MREILFKGKGKYTGEWHKGLLARLQEDYCVIRVERKQIIKDYFCVPSTICQYTGLTDKNGQKIWENDIVYIPQEYGNFVIEWSETEAKWQMNNNYEEFIVDFDNYWSYNVEVIGNIIDNQELLGSEEMI